MGLGRGGEVDVRTGWEEEWLDDAGLEVDEKRDFGCFFEDVTVAMIQITTSTANTPTTCATTVSGLVFFDRGFLDGGFASDPVGVLSFAGLEGKVPTGGGLIRARTSENGIRTDVPLISTITDAG